MKSLSLAAAVALLVLAGSASAAVQSDTGEATHGCGDLRVAILSSLIDDLDSEVQRTAASQKLAQAQEERASQQLDRCEAALDDLTGLLRQAQVLAQ